MSASRHNGSPDKIFCMHCGTEGVVGSYACVRCGERLYFPDPDHPPPLGYIGCAICGGANESHASYCAHCQAVVVDGERVSPMAGESNRGPDLRGNAGHRERAGEAERASGVAVMDESDGDRREQVLVEPGGRSDGEDSQLPSELRGWNWPAFLLGPIWGVGHRIWWTAIGILALAPLVSVGQLRASLLIWLAMMLFLGLRGNELAWRARRWESVDKFVAAQQRWGVWAVVAVVALVTGLVVYMYVQ